MPASTKGEPVGAIAAAMRSTVDGLIALQSTKTGLLLLAVSDGANRRASATASPGGRIDRMKSLAAISSSLADAIPAALARAVVSALRPSSEVSTLRPCSTSRLPTAAPIMPGAMTATTGFMWHSPIRLGCGRDLPTSLHLGEACRQGGGGCPARSAPLRFATSCAAPGTGAAAAWQSLLFALCSRPNSPPIQQETPRAR